MMGLREKIVAIIKSAAEDFSGCDASVYAEEYADDIPAIPEIAHALALACQADKLTGATVAGDEIYLVGKPDTTQQD